MASLALASRADYSHLRAASRDGDVHFIRSFLRERDPYDLTACIEDAETDGCTALWFASAHGHADAVAELLAHNANTEKARDGGATPLIVAAREGHLECVKALVFANADLCASCPGEGRTPMHLAAHRGHADICALLLAHGADPTLEDAKGMTPCMVAAHNGHHAVLRCLVADNGSGAQRFDGEHNFRTAALLLASAEGNAESVRALLQAPADARRAASCLHAALCGGDLASQRVVEVLLKGADVDGATEVVTKSFDGKNGGGTRALHFAAEVRNRGVTKALLDADPDVDALDARGRTPLYVAAHHGHEDVVSSLLSAGAEVNKREKFREETPLFAAARGGHLECVKALCAHEDVDVDARDDHWATPLHAAVAEGHVACVDWLLDRGADPNAADKNMETALHVSVRWADARVTASLLRAGASPAKYTKRGLTPLHLAVSGAGAQSRASASAVSSLSVYGDPANRNGSRVAATRLKRSGQVEDGDWYDLSADQSRRDDIVDMLLGTGQCDVDRACYEGGSTPTYLAARWGHAGFVRKLAGAGADLNAARDRADPALDGKVVGPAGPTPLQAARAKGNAECVAVLLELGASETGSYS